MANVIDLQPRRPPAPPPLDLVESFINTVDLETGSDDLATASAFRGWLLDRKLIQRSDSVDEWDREQAIRLREALRQTAVANNRGAVDHRAVRQLNQVAGRVGMVVAFEADGTVRLDPSVKGVEAALARILGAVFVAMLTGSWARLKACANATCEWAFYDASKNRSARWCEMADCGNDAKGRTYRARRRKISPPSK